MDILKQREELLFEKAQRNNLTVMKSKKGYMIVNYYTNRIVAGRVYRFSLDDVEQFLATAK
jgi:hypothetical protein